MRTRIILTLTFLVSILMPANAVYDEKNLDQSVHVLNNELRDRYMNIGKHNKLQLDRTVARTQLMNDARKQSSIIAMMLYSQKVEYIFGLTYACNMATDLYENFVEKMNPLIVQEHINNNDVVRFDSLINVLERIDPVNLSPKGRKEKEECIEWAQKIKAVTSNRYAMIERSITEYYRTKKLLYNLNLYAQERYKFLQEQLFNNDSETFYHFLQHWDERGPYLKMVTVEEYSVENEVGSDWGINIRKNLFVSFGCGALFAIFIGWLIAFFLRRSTSKNGFISYIKEWPNECHICFVMTCAALIFAITLNIIRLFLNQHFLVMAFDLMGIYSWIFAAILLSSFFMKAGKDVKESMMLYVSLMFLGLLIIFLRVNFFPNLVIAFILPPVILLCALWEGFILHRVWKSVGKIDRVLGSITELIYIALIFCSWNGYILFSVQLITWWMMQQAIIQVLVSLGMYMQDLGIRNKFHQKPIKTTWLYYFVCMLLCPVGALYSVLLSAYWGGDVFNLSEMVLKLFETHFNGTTNVTISLWTILMVVSLWFVARFIYFISKQIVLKEYDNVRITFEQGQSLMYTKVLQVTIYGIWVIISMIMLHISMIWVTAAFTGLCTGLAFASRTILENIFYGISLLSGRLKIGDLVKLGDVYGKVLDIGYSSTVVRNDDGTVVTFTNSQLINMNYRNLTRINEFNKQSMSLNLGIKTDIDKVRKIIIDATSTLPCLHLNEKKHGKPAYQVSVGVKGINSFELASCIIISISYWVDPTTEKHDRGVVTECIINALRDNNIEIL